MESKRGRHINVPVKGKSRRNTFNFEKYTLYFPFKKYYEFILCNTDNTQMVSSMTFQHVLYSKPVLLQNGFLLLLSLE